MNPKEMSEWAGRRKLEVQRGVKINWQICFAVQQCRHEVTSLLCSGLTHWLVFVFVQMCTNIIFFKLLMHKYFHTEHEYHIAKSNHSTFGSTVGRLFQTFALRIKASANCDGCAEHDVSPDATWVVNVQNGRQLAMAIPRGKRHKMKCESLWYLKHSGTIGSKDYRNYCVAFTI